MRIKLFLSGIYTSASLICLFCEPTELTGSNLRIFAAWYAFWIANFCVSAMIASELTDKYVKSKKRKKNE